ncbi:hypothetical protein L195_g059628 [Trifolium pratense]|uniref:Uncharacterized protein n=1 Tax=Trifolium pratense TaxID=57577 RepID=A0A2K3JZ21_TRIPR|nr:hypothetical protein L195_g059628 [Trifolium pratense]
MAMMLMTFDEGKQPGEGYTKDQKDLIAKLQESTDSEKKKLLLYLQRRNELIVKIANGDRACT